MRTELPEESENITRYDVVHTPEPSRRTPLPKLQLFIVFLIQFTEPLTATVIYPFVNQFVRDTGIINGDERRTGYYAGIIASAFFFTEAVTVFHWGWLSDRVGRRPVILLGPFGLAFAMLSFGLSDNFWGLVVSRCVQGVFNGIIGVSKTVIAELTDSTNYIDAFAAMPLTWNVGTTIGPIFGGLLAEPAKDGLPYSGRLLKTKRDAAMALETERNKKYHTRDASSSTTPLLNDDIESYGSDSPAGAISHARRNNGAVSQRIIPKKTVEQAPPVRSLLIPQVLVPVFVYAFQAFMSMSSQMLMPLMYSTSIPVGGLGMVPYRIGVILSVFGCSTAITQLIALPRLIRKMGPRKVNAIAQIGYIFGIGLYPLLKFYAQREGRVGAKAWAVIAIQLVCRSTNGMSNGSVQIIIIDSAPSKAALGAINGMAQAMGCVARSVGPSAAASLFSVSLQRNLVSGNLVYIVLVGCALFSLRLSFLLPRKLRSQSQ